MTLFDATALFNSLERWIAKPGSKLLGGSIVDSAFYPSKMD